MRSKLLTGRRVWQEISAGAKKAPGRCHVAVAYFGSGASRLLPLREGSVLVVDASRAAVTSGQTNPEELLKLIARGVEVHSYGRLHAKVFALGDQAVLGSANASSSSAFVLEEAAVRTSDPHLVRGCRDFVRSLRGELITPDYARKLAKIYRPPRGGHLPQPQDELKREGLQAAHAPLWLARIVPASYDEFDAKAIKEGLRTARKRLQSPRRFEVGKFRWYGTDLDALRPDALVVTLFTCSDGRQMFEPPGRVLGVRRYRATGERRQIVFLERARSQRRKSIERVSDLLGPAARKITSRRGSAFLLRDAALVHALLALWPTSRS